MDGPGPLANRFLHACLVLLGGMIALAVALSILRAILPWLVGIAVAVAAIYGLVWWWRGRASKW